MYLNDYDSEFFREIIEQSSDLFCVTEKDNKIIDVNQSFKLFFGSDKKNSFFFDLLSFAYDDESSFKTKLLNQSNKKYAFINWQKMVDDKSELTFWIGKIDTKQQIESLEETGRMGQIGFWEYDIKKQTVFWSEEVYKIHEEPLEKQIALEVGINYYHPDDLSIIYNAFDKVLNDGIPFEVELRIVTANNRIKWIKSIGERVEIDGKPVKVKGTFQDIHRTKTAELKLIQNQMLLQQILDSLPVGIFWKDKDGVYQGFNKSSTDFIGKSPKELIGKSDKDLIKSKILLTKVLKQDQEIIKYQKVYSEIRNVKLNRETIHSIELNKLPIYNEKKEVAGILGVYIDNTKLVNLIRSLEQKNNELNELLFATSHDLKEPLQGINRYAQLLKRHYNTTLETHGNQMLDYILREAKRQYEQFNGLTRFLEIGNNKREISKLNLNDIINNAVYNIDFNKYNYPEFEVKVQNFPKIQYNEYDLEVVFYELIQNALKFRDLRQKLIIDISMVESKESWKVIFADNGEGFDINLKSKVFMIFQKLHNKYYYDGAGIGLSICKKIIEYYGGEIDVESIKDEGTTFIFTIPKTIIQVENIIA
jgi:PAS domain S-box-containing protein